MLHSKYSCPKKHSSSQKVMIEHHYVVFLQNLTRSSLLHDTWSLISALMNTYHWTLPWASWFHSTCTNSISPRCILISPSPLFQCHPPSPLPQGFSFTKICMQVLSPRYDKTKDDDIQSANTFQSKFDNSMKPTLVSEGKDINLKIYKVKDYHFQGHEAVW